MLLYKVYKFFFVCRFRSLYFVSANLDEKKEIMISASDPQVFAPHGRKHMERHPGEVVLPSTHPQLQPESFLLHRLSQVAISESNKEWWTIKSGTNGEHQYEDELYVSGKTVVWSHGIVSGENRAVLRCYTSENVIQHALWCTFYCSTENSSLINGPFSEEPKGEPMHCVCVVDNNNVSTYTLDGKDYVTSLPFEVQSIWPTKFGVLLEAINCNIVNDPVDCHSLHGVECGQVPTVFSLSHPLDEIAPVVSQKIGFPLSYISDSSHKVVFTSDNPSICMTYDSKTGLHSVWKIRKLLPEENQNITTRMEPSHCVEDTQVSDSVRSNLTSSTQAYASVQSHLSSLVTSRDRFPNLYNLYDTRSAVVNNNSNSVQTSRAQSPMAALSRCQSPSICDTNRLMLSSSPQGWVARAIQKIRSPLAGPSVSHSAVSVSHHDKALSSYFTIETSEMDAKPLLPEICFEHQWTEAQSFVKDMASGCASEVFLSTNFTGQTFLCYLVQSQFQLVCVQLKDNNLNAQRLTFGASSTIAARHAANLPLQHMIAIVDLTGSVVLYSGLNFISKVYIPGIAAAVLQPSYISFNQFLSPFPKRSSLLSNHPASAMEPNFDESVHLLSPVVADTSHTPSHLDTSSLDECSSQTGLVRLRDSVGNRVTLEYSNGSYYRLSIPQLCSSRLVSDCLSALKTVLQHDLAMQLFIKWYGMRNAPGTQNISEVA